MRHSLRATLPSSRGGLMFSAGSGCGSFFGSGRLPGLPVRILSAVGFGGRARRNAGDMYDFFSVDYDYGDGVHVHSMCRQVTGCWNWVGHDFIYEKGRTSGSDGPAPKKSAFPADLPQMRAGHQQEQVNVLYYLAKGKPLRLLSDVEWRTYPIEHSVAPEEIADIGRWLTTAFNRRG